MKMPSIKSFSKPDEVRTFPHGRIELVNINGGTIGRGIFEPGWKWSESIKPIVKTKSCEINHFMYQLSGVMKAVMDDGSEYTSRAGEITYLPAGHDAWVVGNEPVEVVDFQGSFEHYAEAH